MNAILHDVNLNYFSFKTYNEINFIYKGTTYETSVALQTEQDITTIPDRLYKPTEEHLDNTTSYDSVFFDLETTGFGMFKLKYVL